MLGRFIFTALFAAFFVASDHSPAFSASKRASGQKLSLEDVNSAQWRGKGGNVSTALLVKLQILLDRAHASPGQIDATRGENTRKAIVAYRDMRGLAGGERIDEPLWRALTDHDSEPALTTYVITEKDVAGPFIEKVPDDYREKASLKRLGYTSVEEMLAEKFHMSEQLLRRLNPAAAFDQPGTEIVVPNVQRDELPRKVARARSQRCKATCQRIR